MRDSAQLKLAIRSGNAVSGHRGLALKDELGHEEDDTSSLFLPGRGNH